MLNATTATAPGLTANDAPTLPTILSVDAGQFRAALKATRVAVATCETRYYMCGVYLEVESDHARCTATDGHRLVSVEMRAVHVARGGAFIVPTETVDKLIKALRTARGNVIIESDGAEILFTYTEYAAPITIRSKLVAGQYPQWRRVLPQRVPVRDRTVFAFQPRAMLAALDQIEIGRKAIPGATVRVIRLSRAGDGLKVSADALKPVWRDKVRTITRGKNRGKQHVERELADYETFPLSADVPGGGASELGRGVVGFNPAYLRDFLRGAKSTILLYAPTDHPQGPWTLQSGDGVLRILMPCRV